MLMTDEIQRGIEEFYNRLVQCPLTNNNLTIFFLFFFFFFDITHSNFLDRLEKSIVALSSNILPFTEKGNVIEKLKNSSEKFRLSCYVYDNAA